MMSVVIYSQVLLCAELGVHSAYAVSFSLVVFYIELQSKTEWLSVGV